MRDLNSGRFADRATAAEAIELALTTRVDFVSDLAKNVALDEISQWRPNWDEKAWKKIYYGGIANREVATYNNVTTSLVTLSYIEAGSYVTGS